ncbi:MAG: uroporphyrinogen III methyltransferase [Planctomycetota bacterium]|nr:MAG: uroporphyrinogen III methyltransferase [Planctomycetota bacterium]
MSTLGPASLPPGGHVALVGAGPGDPGLLTRRGHDLLLHADVVLYDRLVDTRLLDIPYKPACRRVYVGKELPGRASRDAQQRRINATMVREARRGKRVVRLKGGDPFIFGRGGEEAAVLAAAKIRFEVVPGVTAALGAAATTGIPFTHRGVAQEVTFATAHGAKGGTPPPWSALGKLKGTIVFYMGTYTLGLAAKKLVAAGRRASTPVAVVERATTVRQRVVTGTLATIAARAEAAAIHPPSLVIVGDAVGLRGALDWFERRPLFGRSILVTRPEEDDPGSQQLAELGAEVTRLPGLEFRPASDTKQLDRALRSLSRFDWVVFTSPRGVQYTDERVEKLGLDARAFGSARCAAIGWRTSLILGAYLKVRADLVPKDERAEGLAEALRKRGVRGKRVLLLRADEGRDVLPKLLRKAGARVSDVVAYEHAVPKPDRAVVARLAAGEFHAAQVTSGEIAATLKGWLGRRPWPERTKLVTIGPVTSAAVREIGWPVAREAKEPGKLDEATIEALEG